MVPKGKLYGKVQKILAKEKKLSGVAIKRTKKPNEPEPRFQLSDGEMLYLLVCSGQLCLF